MPKNRVNQGLFWQINNLQNAPEIVPVQFRELLEIIRAIPALEIFNNMQQLTLYYQGNIDFFFLVKWLVSRAQQTDTKTAINDLVNYLGLEEFEVHEILTFECRGFEVDTVLRMSFKPVLSYGTNFPRLMQDGRLHYARFTGRVCQHHLLVGHIQ